MFALAVSLGIYSYLILALGLIGWLNPILVFSVSLPFLAAGIIWFKNNFHFNYLKWLKLIKKEKLIAILVGILSIQIIINFLGAISPELSFDALWYHLTPPKIYVQNQRILHIPGWLLSVSTMPRLTEMFYTVALLFSNEILAKLIHFSFGILSAIALFNLLKRYFSLRVTFLGLVTFYTILMVGWQSTTSYVDLVRTFFEILALDYFLQWLEKKKEDLLWRTAILTGLAISTKLLAFGTLGTLGILILLVSKEKKLERLVKFVLLALLVVSPWLILSWVNTGNLFFPFGVGSFIAGTIGAKADFAWFTQRFTKLPLLLWQVTIHPDDIISPIYLIFLPLVLISIWKQKLSLKIAGLYFLFGAFFAPTESNRYLLPYLPGFTLFMLSVFNYNWNKNKIMERFLIGLIIFSAILNTGSRGLATRKFLPYLLKQESKAEFLTKHLNFSFGDFYDVDGWFAKNIKKDDLVLIYGIHNLYYVKFPFVHESWARPGMFFTHILVGDGQELPKKFGKRLLIYQNPKTRVKLYAFGDKYQ